jgi:hypothetical protein
MKKKEIIALFGGSFKPPHIGHFNVVKEAITLFPEIDSFKILIGSGVRNNINQNTSYKIWEIYKKYLPKNIILENSVSPIGDIKRYAKQNPDKDIYFILGIRENNNNDLIDVKERTKDLYKYPNIKFKIIRTNNPTQGKLIRENIEQINNHLPKEITKTDILNINNILKEINSDEIKYWAMFAHLFTRLEKSDNPKIEYDELKNKLEGENLKALNYFYNEYFQTGKSTLNENIKQYYPSILSKTEEEALKLVRKNWDKFNGKECNKGFCDIFAKNLQKLLPNSKIIHTEESIPNKGTFGHVWLKYKNKYYDAETPNGVNSWKKLPWIINFKNEMGKYPNVEILKEQLNENATYSKDINYKKHIIELSEYYLLKYPNLKILPKVKFIHGNKENANNLHTKTGYYDPNTKTIVIYTEGRHPRDIISTFSHEMIHYIQDIEGRLNNIQTTNTTEDSNLDNIEREAYENGNIIFRNWKDHIKKQKEIDPKGYYHPLQNIKDEKDPYGLNMYALELAKGLEEELLDEAKQVGILYHYTLGKNLTDIIFDNKLYAHDITSLGKDKKPINAISFTRNPNFHTSHKMIMGTEARIILDGNKLSNKYKIEPYAEFSFRSPKKTESEERIVFPTGNQQGIENLKQYVISYDLFINKIYVEDLIEIMNDLNTLNIPISNNIKLNNSPGNPVVRYFNKDNKIMSKEEIENLYLKLTSKPQTSNE